MRTFLAAFSAFIAMQLALAPVHAIDLSKFDADKMLTDLESQLTLSSEKLNQMKPVLDQKSAELKQSVHESVDRGFMHMEQLSSQLDTASREVEAKLREALTSDEMQQLKAYMKKIDSDAIKEITDELTAKLTKFLELTEDQITKVQPILEESFNQLSELLTRLQREGAKSLGDFTNQFEALNMELKQRLRNILDGKQIEKLEANRDELGEKIKQALFSS